MEQQQKSKGQQYNRHMVQAMAVVDIDSNLRTFNEIVEQKYITSLHFSTEPANQAKVKSLYIAKGVYLLISYIFAQTQQMQLSIFQIDLFSDASQITEEWVPVKMFNPNSPLTALNAIGGILCYRTQDSEGTCPLTDIDTLLIQKKSRFGESKQVITVPHGYHMVSSPIGKSFLIYKKVRNKLEQNFKPALLQKYQPFSNRISLAKLPEFCFPQGIRLSKEMTGFITQSCVFTLQDGQRIYCTCLIFKESLPQIYRKKLKIKNNEQIYCEKALCILSQYCYTDEFSECLHHLYRISMSKHELPFYKVAQNFVDSMILPKDQGKMGICYSYCGCNIIFKTNNRYPTVSQKAIYSVFKFLQLSNVIKVFEAMLLEQSIIFVSQSKTVLGYATQAFASLLYPFKWEMSLIPILPSTMKDFLNAPVPIIVGVSPSMIEQCEIETQSVIVYLDKNDVIADSLPPLPDKLEKILYKRLCDFQVYEEDQVRQYLENQYNNFIFQMQEVDYAHFQGHIIRDIFYEFMLTLMKNYKKFWRKGSFSQKKNSFGFSTEPQLMNDMFKTQEFLSDLGMTKVGSFGYKFTESSIFTCFIERRYQNANDPQLDFFDQCIAIKKNKKEVSFIWPVHNDKYQVAAHPSLQPGKSYYQYSRFPSILKQSFKVQRNKEKGAEIIEGHQNKENEQFQLGIVSQFQNQLRENQIMIQMHGQDRSDKEKKYFDQ